MIYDPDDAIRRMTSRHEKRKQPPSKSEETRDQQDALRAAVVAMLLDIQEDKQTTAGFDVAIIDLAEYSGHHITYTTYEDELAATPERKMRLKVTVTQG